MQLDVGIAAVAADVKHEELHLGLVLVVRFYSIVSAVVGALGFLAEPGSAGVTNRCVLEPLFYSAFYS
jgi:hypothetical protein